MPRPKTDKKYSKFFYYDITIKKGDGFTEFLHKVHAQDLRAFLKVYLRTQDLRLLPIGLYNHIIVVKEYAIADTRGRTWIRFRLNRLYKQWEIEKVINTANWLPE